MPAESIGVGMYQHDINKTELSDAVEHAVQKVVNSVGVNLNTASGALLQVSSRMCLATDLTSLLSISLD